MLISTTLKLNTGLFADDKLEVVFRDGNQKISFRQMPKLKSVKIQNSSLLQVRNQMFCPPFMAAISSFCFQLNCSLNDRTHRSYVLKPSCVIVYCTCIRT